MKRFNCLDPNMPICGKFFLEASAGTGKTFAIEHLFTRFLLQEEPFQVKEILIVTFTNAAISDLKGRIRVNLENAIIALQAKDIKAVDYLRCIIKQDLQDQMLLRLQKALVDIESAQIFTIHSFCQRMLLEFAFEAKLGFTSAPLEERKHLSILKEEVIRFFRSTDIHTLLSQNQLTLFFQGYKQEFDLALQGIISLLEKEGTYRGCRPFTENYSLIVKEFENVLGQVLFQKESFIADVYQLAQHHQKICSRDKRPKDVYAKQIELIASCLEKKSISESDLNTLISKDPFVFSLFIEGNQKKSFPSDLYDKLRYKVLIQEIQKRFSPIFERMSSFELIALEIASYVEQNVKKRLQEEEITPPDLILIKMQTALKQHAFRKGIVAKYRAVIIDEFQDTDPIQWDIFKQLFIDEKNVDAFYLVGDPKQSIYSFRNADIFTYQQALETLGKENRYFLDVNYRSSPGLLHALNALFSHDNLGKWLSFKELNIDYHKVEVGKKEISFEKNAVHFFLGKGPGLLKSSADYKLLEEQVWFPRIASELTSLSKEGKNLSDIAILIKDRFQGQRLRHYFDKNSIAAQYQEDKFITETEAFSFLQIALLATYQPKKLSTLKQVLIHSFIGMKSQDLLESRETLFQKEIRIFFSLRAILFEDGIIAFLHRLFDIKLHGNKTLLERLLGQGRSDDYSDLLEIATLMEIEGKYFSHDYLKALTSLEQKAKDKNPALKRRSNMEKKGVRIMTTHKSKGLEFDVVFALGMSTPSNAKMKFIQHRSREITKFDPREALSKEHKDHLEMEMLRQLYVAFTRAKEKLYAFIPFDCEGALNIDSNLRISPIELFCQKWLQKQSCNATLSSIKGLLGDLPSDETVSFEEVFSNFFTPQTSRENQKVVLEKYSISDFSFPNYYKHSFSSLKKESKRETDFLLESSIPAGKEVGTLFHSLFEHIFSNDHTDMVNDENLAFFLEEKLRFTPLELHQDSVFEIMQNALATPFSNEIPALAQIPSENFFVEGEFFLSMDIDRQNFLKGFIDLTFIWENKVYLLDWKSNFLGEKTADYSEENIFQNLEDADYLLQAKLYLDAMEKYLSQFPSSNLEIGGMYFIYLRGLVFGKGCYFFSSASEIIR